MLDPKDYPFNYIVHEGNDQFPFATYPDAEAFVRANFPELIIDEHWSSNEESPVYALPCFATPLKLAWDKSDLEEFRKINRLDEDEWPDGRDLIIEACELASGQVSIERRRDAYESAQLEAYESAQLEAYESAQLEAYLTDGRLDMADDSRYEEEEFTDEEE